MENEKKEVALSLSKEEVDQLLESNTRFLIIGELVRHLYCSCFSDQAPTILYDNNKMWDWIVCNYDLTSCILAEISRTIEEQTNMVDDILYQVKRG